MSACCKFLNLANKVIKPLRFLVDDREFRWTVYQPLLHKFVIRGRNCFCCVVAWQLNF